MRTTIDIDSILLDEVQTLSGSKTKRAAIEKALAEYIRRRKAKLLFDLAGKVELSLNVDELIRRRRKDVPHR